MRDGLKDRYVDHERGAIIVGQSYRKGVREANKAKRMNAAISKQTEAWREGFKLDTPPLLIRMNENTEGIPAGIPIELPREYSTALIRVRVSIPVGDFKIVPSLVISEDEIG
jgi:hypothetical protein